MTITKWIIDRLAELLDKEIELKPRHVPLTNYERLSEELRQGDVLLVEGRSRISNIIKTITCSPWTHSALYLGRLDDIKDGNLKNKIAEFYSGDPRQQLVIEALLGTGTTVNPLNKYDGEHLRICRPKGLSMSDRQEIISFALSHLGYEYDIRHLLDLARFLLPYSIMPRRWRSTLFTRNPGQSTRNVCSYMIGEAFASVSFPILPVAERLEDGEFRIYKRNTKLLSPKDFDYSPYFDIIKYPFLNLDEVAAYRSLPWGEEKTYDTTDECRVPENETDIKHDAG